MQAYVVVVWLKYFIAIMSCFPFNTLVCRVTKNTPFSMSTAGFHEEECELYSFLSDIFTFVCASYLIKREPVSTQNATKSLLVTVYSHQK